MESNGMAEGMIPGMLGLEMSLHQIPPPQQQQQQQHRQMMLFPSQLHPGQHADADAQRVYSFGAGPAHVKPAASPDDDPAAAYGDDLGGMDLAGMKQLPQQQQAGVSTSSPWQRMKWTDAMVRLLIMVVYCVGDEGGADHHQGNKPATAGKKGGGAAASAMQQQQQKKGKWKSVSRAMMEKGYYVSPQQCEDKFNDLNKRYKRVNDILGRGTACRVVENQALLDSMDHLSPKAKEEARKLLNSKHLFFREMCAYHRSCAASADAGSSGSSALLQQHQSQPPHAQACEAAAFLHGSDPYSLQQQASKVTGGECRGGQEEEEDYDDEEEDEDEEDEQYYDEEEEEEEEDGDEPSSKRRDGGGMKRKRASPSPEALQLKGELAALAGPTEQQRQWLSWRAVELEERRVSSGRRALELERQRLKWLRYSGNKEREMERAKLENERQSLENERMLLLLRHKELELACSSSKAAAPSLDHTHNNDGPSASAA